MRKLVAMFKKLTQQIDFGLRCNGCLFCGMPIFVWAGAYKRNVVAVNKMVTYNHGVLILYGCPLQY